MPLNHRKNRAMAHAGAAWTEAEDAVLDASWNRGEPAEAIAVRLGRTAAAVLFRANKRGLARRAAQRSLIRRLSEAELESLKAAYTSGDTLGAIAARLGCPPSAVRQAARTLGLRRPAAVRGKTRRRCLKCGSDFPSDGPGNRVCDLCKDEDDWQNPGILGVRETWFLRA